jgi:hypothetical protein
MFAFVIGVAAICAVNVWVSRSAHEEGLDLLPTGPLGS